MGREVPGGTWWFVLFLIGNLPYLPWRGPIRWADLSQYEGPDSYAALSGQTFKGPGLQWGPVTLEVGKVGLLRTGHDAVKKFYQDPNAPRELSFSDILPAANVSDPGFLGFFLPGTLPFALHISTNDPRWWAMRDLWSATVPAIGQKPKYVPDFRLPIFAQLDSICTAANTFDKAWSGVFQYLDASRWVPNELDYLFKFNFFRHVFEIELSENDITKITEWFGKFATIQFGCNAACAADGARRQKEIMDMVKRGAWSKEFFREAQRRGLNGEEQLNSLVMAFIVAGSGAPGCLMTGFNVLEYLRSDKAWIEVYEKDPDAFILETLRLHHGGGTQTSYRTIEENTWTLGNGVVVKEPKNAPTMASVVHAGHDPNIWGGPSKDQAHAEKFLPGRANRLQTLSFLSEMGDIRNCPNATGCAGAVRFCPGAHLCPRITRQLADFYVKRCVRRKTRWKDEM